MSQKKWQRIKVVENAVEEQLSVAEAAELLQLSNRQVRRLKRAYDPADAGWVHHGNRDWEPSNAISEELRKHATEFEIDPVWGPSWPLWLICIAGLGWETVCLS